MAFLNTQLKFKELFTFNKKNFAVHGFTLLHNPLPFLVEVSIKYVDRHIYYTI